ncbi:MAG: enoyl-CoA hydratase, partial [Microbacteriaceae bacterium]|nr:enoyl-CoA hydratase [Microbacteriaceae bacterium]
GPRALVVVGDGKFWSNGLDLEWMQAHPAESPGMIDALHDLYAAILAAPFPTVAALQGHCYAGGAIMSMAFDLRIMREDRGFFCFPEVSIRIPFSPGMSSLISAKLRPQAATRAMVFGTRFTGPDALAAGIVDETVDEAGLLARALAVAAELAPASGATMGTIKSTLYAPVLEALRSHAPIDLSGILHA